MLTLHLEANTIDRYGNNHYKKRKRFNRTRNKIRRYFQEQKFLDKFILSYNYNSDDHQLSGQPWLLSQGKNCPNLQLGISGFTIPD